MKNLYLMMYFLLCFLFMHDIFMLLNYQIIHFLYLLTMYFNLVKLSYNIYARTLLFLLAHACCTCIGTSHKKKASAKHVQHFFRASSSKDFRFSKFNKKPNRFSNIFICSKRLVNDVIAISIMTRK
jgi:hypothetical protein